MRLIYKICVRIDIVSEHMHTHHRDGDVICDRYKISVRPGFNTPLLGKGSFGQVVYAIDMTENLGVAIKVNYVCVYICIYIYLYGCIYIYIYIYVYIYIYMGGL
jgi:hypothetical protein